MLLSVSELKDQLNRPLPGLLSQLKMAPENRKEELIRASSVFSSARLSAVLVLLYPEVEGLKTILIKRSEYDGVHSGQMAFPGGKTEHGETLEQTALREAREEIGLETEKVQILGRLTDIFLPPSNFLVKVYVGYQASMPCTKPDPKEVREIVDFYVDDFLDEANRSIQDFYSPSLQKSFSAPCFHIRDYTIWGATAMIISELIDVLATR